MAAPSGGLPGGPTPEKTTDGTGKRADKPPSSKKRREPWRIAFFGVLVLAILVGAAWALLGSSLLVVRHERVTGNRTVPAARILAAAGIKHGTPLQSVNTAAAARRVERINQVLSATVSRSWPDGIVISVRERTPVLAVASGRRFALIDGSGVIVSWSSSQPAGMPRLTAPALAQVHGSSAVLSAAAVVRELPASLRALVKSVAATGPDAVSLHLRSRVTVLWGGPGQAAAKAAELTVLLRTGARHLDVSDPSTVATQG